MQSVATQMPFARLNLLRNPFGELTREDRVRAAIIDTPRWMQWLSKPKHAVQMLADCGRGKSTHLLAIASQYPQAAYVYLPEDERCPAIPIGSPLLIDEAQRLPWRRRREAFSRGVPLVLGTHVDLGGPLGRAGYRVQTYHVGQDLSPDRLAVMMNRRIELARLQRGQIPVIDIRDAGCLIQRHGNNIRAIESVLYSRFQILVRR